GSAAQASLRLVAHLGRRSVRVHGEIGVIRLAAHIAHLKHEILGELAFHCKAPLLDGGREHVRINGCRLIDRAWLRYPGSTSGRGFRSPLERDEGKQW